MTKNYFVCNSKNEIRFACIYCLTKDMGFFHLISYPEITSFYEKVQNFPARGYFYLTFDKKLNQDENKKIVNDFDSSFINYYHKTENNFCLTESIFCPTLAAP